MVSIKKQIIDELIEEDFIDNVRDFYSTEKPTFDMLTVQEFPSNTGIMVDNQPRVVENYYEFEIYCKNKVVDNVVVTANNRITDLVVELDLILNTKYGMTLIGEPVIEPHPNDNTIMRCITRYSAFIDKVSLNLYRR